MLSVAERRMSATAGHLNIIAFCTASGRFYWAEFLVAHAEKLSFLGRKCPYPIGSIGSGNNC
jgi:hypothetical protein